MKLTRSLGIATTIALVGALVLAYIPSGAAQVNQADFPASFEKTAEVQKNLGPDGRVTPDSETASTEFTFDVKIPGNTVCPGDLITLEFSWVEQTRAPHAIVSISPSAISKPFEGKGQAPGSASTEPNTMKDWKVKVDTTFKQTAPALEPQVIYLRAKLTAGTGLQSGTCSATNPQKQEQDFPITLVADFQPIVQFLPKEAIQKAGQNAKVVFPIDIQNLSNGDISVDSDFKGGDGLAITPPADGVIVESRAARGDKAQITKTVNLVALTPTKNGYTNKVYPFEAMFTFTSAKPASNLPAKGESSVPLSIKVQGVYVPGFDATSMVAALGVALLGVGVARRRLK